MKICLIHTDLNPPWMWVEGVRKLAYELSRQLTRHGHSVYVITSVRNTLPFEEEIEGIYFHRIGSKHFTLSLPGKVRQLYKQYMFDIIHFQNTLLLKSFLPTLASIRSSIKAPLVTYMCQQPTIRLQDIIKFFKLELGSEEILSHLLYYLSNVIAPNFFIRTEFNLVDKIIVSSNYLKRYLLDLGVPLEKVKVIYPFINTEEFSEGFGRNNLRKKLEIDEKMPLILYVGGPRATRLAVFMKALSIVARSIHHFRVLVVTPSSLFMKKFLDNATKLGLRDFIVPISGRTRMASMMSASDVFVYPGFSAIASIDPPLTIIEAVASGLPIIACDTGGISEIIGSLKGCFLIKPFDYKGMAEALVRVLRNACCRSRLDRIIKKVDLMEGDFDSALAAERFISIYESLALRK